jgi:hypothetical protein
MPYIHHLTVTGVPGIRNAPSMCPDRAPTEPILRLQWEPFRVRFITCNLRPCRVQRLKPYDACLPDLRFCNLSCNGRYCLHERSTRSSWTEHCTTSVTAEVEPPRLASASLDSHRLKPGAIREPKTYIQPRPPPGLRSTCGTTPRSLSVVDMHCPMRHLHSHV